ncbi:unnamed protein product [Mytilus coruscus]|uniref:Uncharacterized protein n=1 Tax=Mytilus coruscus TaxID=42192 RepID=A0A6J8EHD6_MYTCO|nr:unnamed protein product [Mytilus coruscus]
MEGMINTKLLKNWILTAVEDMQAHTKGSVVLLIFNEYVGEILKQTMSYSRDDEGLIIYKDVVCFRASRIPLLKIKRTNLPCLYACRSPMAATFQFCFRCVVSVLPSMTTPSGSRRLSPAIIPVATCSNLQGITIEQKKKTSNTTSDTAAAPTSCKNGKHQIEAKDAEVNHAEAVGSGGKSKTIVVTIKLKTEERVMNLITELSKELQEKEEERMRNIKEMHIEQMAATHRFMDCFENFMNQKKNKD